MEYNGYICKICSEAVTEKNHFWKKHRVAEKKYFEEYEPKEDLLTKEKILFKGSYENYCQTNFVKRLNLKKYIEKLPKSAAIDYLSKWLQGRVEFKKLLFAPTEFEIKQLQFPSIQYLEDYFGSGAYQDLTKGLGLVDRFDYKHSLSFHNEPLNLIVDTREQCILKFDNFQVEKFDVGDYSIQGSNVYIERKSLNDFLGTMSQGYERFNNEIQRAVVQDKYIVVLVEEKYGNLSSYPYLPHCKKIKAEPIFIHHRVREMMQLYPLNMQFLAVDGRGEAVRAIENIFKLKRNIKEIDLQFSYNKKEL